MWRQWRGKWGKGTGEGRTLARHPPGLWAPIDEPFLLLTNMFFLLPCPLPTLAKPRSSNSCNV
jgi:hypothetical protein